MTSPISGEYQPAGAVCPGFAEPARRKLSGQTSGGEANASPASRPHQHWPTTHRRYFNPDGPSEE